jgi:hypothetical protein
LVDDFAGPLTTHLQDEIETLKTLDKYDSEKVRQAYRRLEKLLMDTDNVRHQLRNREPELADDSLVSHRTARVWNGG